MTFFDGVVSSLHAQIVDLRQQAADWEQSSANWQILYQQTKEQLAEAEAEVTDLRSQLPPDSDGCYTMPDGSCVSPGPCMHTPVPE